MSSHYGILAFRLLRRSEPGCRLPFGTLQACDC
jgi:hypothetical protein